MTNTREMFFPVDEIVLEFIDFLKSSVDFDVVSIVGEGEPTLYLGLGDLILELKKHTDKPIVVITNGSLLYDKDVQKSLENADIVLPSLDGYDEKSFKRINRPYGKISYEKVREGIIEFSHNFQGQIWLEIMLLKDINDDEKSIEKYRELLKEIRYEKLYLNTPVRPPAEKEIEEVDHSKMLYAVKVLGGISIDLLKSNGFHSEIENDLEAIKSIIARHPMNQVEIEAFLESRGCDKKTISKLLGDLESDPGISAVLYKGYKTYRIK